MFFRRLIKSRQARGSGGIAEATHSSSTSTWQGAHGGGGELHSMPPHPGPPMPHDRHYHEPPPGLEPPPRTWSNQSVAGSTTGMTASTSTGTAASSVRESLMAKQRRAESVLDSTARLVKLHEAVSVAMKLHKQEAKRTRGAHTSNFTSYFCL